MLVGKLGSARFTLDWTSENATSVLLFSRNWIVTTEVPSDDTEDMLSIEEIVLTCFSISSVTVESISSGEAPGRVVVTVMVGMSTLGN